VAECDRFAVAIHNNSITKEKSYYAVPIQQEGIYLHYWRDLLEESGYSAKDIPQAGGIDGKKIDLQIYDDRNDVQVAAKIAREIADSRALAVIGHYSSSTSLVAGKIYQAYGIPAITGSATADDVTKWNNWYFRSTFVNSRQGLFIGNYISKILKRSQFGQGSYG